MAKPWAWADIKAALEKRGRSLTSLAEKHNLTVGTLSGVKTRPNARSQQRIAAAIGAKPQTIWPDRYDRNGEPVRGRS